MENTGSRVLHLIYGSNSVRGLYHENEDRFSVAVANSWPMVHLDASVAQGQHKKDHPCSETGLPCENDACPKLLQMEHLELLLPPVEKSVSRLKGATSSGAVQGCGVTGSSAVHLERQHTLTPLRISSERAFLFNVCDGHDSHIAAEFVSLECANALQKAWFKRLSHALGRIYDGEDSSALLLSPRNSAHPSLGQSWQENSSIAAEFERPQRLVQGAFNRAFRDIEGNFRSYTAALTSELGLPECTSGTVRRKTIMVYIYWYVSLSASFLS